MKKIFLQLIIILLGSLLLLDACKSTEKRPKAPKPGKPIPCPQKDC